MILLFWMILCNNWINRVTACITLFAGCCQWNMQWLSDVITWKCVLLFENNPLFTVELSFQLIRNVPHNFPQRHIPEPECEVALTSSRKRRHNWITTKHHEALFIIPAMYLLPWYSGQNCIILCCDTVRIGCIWWKNDGVLPGWVVWFTIHRYHPSTSLHVQDYRLQSPYWLIFNTRAHSTEGFSFVIQILCDLIFTVI